MGAESSGSAYGLRDWWATSSAVAKGIVFAALALVVVVAGIVIVQSMVDSEKDQQIQECADDVVAAAKTEDAADMSSARSYCALQWELSHDGQ